MDSLYTLYSRSPQNQEQLKECAAKLTLQVRRIGRVLDTRWVTSSYRTVSAVWDRYDALCAHFSMAMSDVTRPPLDRNKYSRAHSTMSSFPFFPSFPSFTSTPNIGYIQYIVIHIYICIVIKIHYKRHTNNTIYKYMHTYTIYTHILEMR